MKVRRFRSTLFKRMGLGAVGAIVVTAASASVPGAAFAAHAVRSAADSTPAAVGTISSSPDSVSDSVPDTATSTPNATNTNASSPNCSPSVFSTAQQRVENELEGRVSQLEDLTNRVNASSAVTSSDKATLLSKITGIELPGIEALQTEVRGETTCVALRADAHSMVFDYRVYLVMTPETDLVLATDRAAAIEARLVGLESTISGAIARLQATAGNLNGAQDAYADFEARVSAAEGLTDGQSASLLVLTPQGYPANASTLHGARANLQTVRQDLIAARADLNTIREDLS
ncbi:MAG TPA: hypothetical protein VEJ87_01260 [Acidimicrobiales bacterium]|nr:hypothetical protein [Acidimicrobiales bacterium]